MPRAILSASLWGRIKERIKPILAIFFYCFVSVFRNIALFSLKSSLIFPRPYNILLKPCFRKLFLDFMSVKQRNIFTNRCLLKIKSLKRVAKWHLIALLYYLIFMLLCFAKLKPCFSVLKPCFKKLLSDFKKLKQGFIKINSSF